MKKSAIDLNNPELLTLARRASERGARIARLVKYAADAATISYWSEYFKQYGDQWVRPLAAKKVASTQGVAHDIPIRVTAQAWVTSMPDAFEYSLRFALQASGVDVQHAFVDVDHQGRMTGFAHCAAYNDGSSLAPDFAQKLGSSISTHLANADFPCQGVMVEASRQASGGANIIEAAREGQSLAKLTAQFGLPQAKLAKACVAKEAAGLEFHALRHIQAKAIVAQLEDEAPVFSGEPTSEEGATAQVGKVNIQIKYDGLKSPNAFQWFLFGPEKQVLEQGENENWDQAVGDVKVALPDAASKSEKKEAALKQTLIAALGPVAQIERLASIGDLSEMRVQTKKGSTIWCTVQGGKLVDQVSF